MSFQTDNMTAEAVVNNRVQLKHLKAMAMRIHWLKCREAQGQFISLTLSRLGLGGHLGGVLESSVHTSAYSGPINMIPSAKWIFYVLPIHVARSIMQIGPLVSKLQQVTGLCGR